MNYHAVPRKRRNHPAIEKSSQAFSDAIHNRDAELAAQIVFCCALEVGGVKSLMNASRDAYNFLRRNKDRGTL